MKKEAEESGAPVSTVSTLRYDHDLDTRDTDTRGSDARATSAQHPDARAGRPSARSMVAAIQARKDTGGVDGLDDRFQRLSKLFTTQNNKSGGNKKRRSSSRAREKLPSFGMPEIVITQEAFGGRRVGGL